MIKVYHVQIGDAHYYFGSKKAIYDVLDKEQLGIGYTSLRNVKNLDTVPYKNKKCIIRSGILLQASSGKTNDESIERTDSQREE